MAALEAQLARHESVLSFVDDSGMTLLHWASLRGHAAVVRMLIAASRPINQVAVAPLLDAVDAGGCSSLHYASQEGHLEVVVTLLYHGASVDLLDRQRKSPWVEAIEGGHVAVGRLLLARGAVLVVEASDGAALRLNEHLVTGPRMIRGG